MYIIRASGPAGSAVYNRETAKRALAIGLDLALVGRSVEVETPDGDAYQLDEFEQVVINSSDPDA